MANFDDKFFLDLQGLQAYDELIKEYIKKTASSNETVNNLIVSLAEMAETVEAQGADIEANEEAIAVNSAAITVLNSDSETEGSVANQVKKAVDDLVNGAPEALDTLKEIADWIGEDETGTSALINRVAENEDKIARLEQENADLKAYSDAQDEAVYESIKAIKHMEIKSLFPVAQKADESAAEAISALNDGEALKLNSNQEIAGDISIEKSCYIDANGSTFTGVVTVPADAEVIIENATFSNPVVVA